MHTLQQLKTGQLTGTKRIKLSCELTDFPTEILDLHETLEILDLSGNRLTHLPADFGRLKNLRIAFFSNNDFTELPAVLAHCPKLEIVGFKACKLAHIPADAFPEVIRWLILTDNQLTEIPPSVGRCSRLQKLMLAGNKLKQLPAEMASCLNLQLLRISANDITVLPDWLTTLPRLSWLAFAGNPSSMAKITSNTLAEIYWNHLVVQEQLGEGASGIIAKAHWQNKTQDGYSKQVAVKVFKGDVTSDGLPLDEMAACMAAGAHPNLVQVLGQVSRHPEQKQALVLDLIPDSFRNLGGPPDFNTCTRDTFPEGTTFFLHEIIRIVTGIASAAAHLHACGIMHGDLYAHNILIGHDAHPLLGDFGAATFYDRTDTERAASLERLEVRAFGCLLEDLTDRLAPEDRNLPSVPALIRLQQDCLTTDVKQRPGFEAICERIGLITGSEQVC